MTYLVKAIDILPVWSHVHFVFEREINRVYSYSYQLLRDYWKDNFNVILHVESYQIYLEFESKEKYVLFMLEWS